MLKKTVHFSTLLLLAIFVAKAQFELRSVGGVVTDKRGNALPGAVVQLENSETLAITTYITDGQGRNLFSRLYDNVDYILRAKYRTDWSKPKTLSKFNSIKPAEIDLTIPTE